MSAQRRKFLQTAGALGVAGWVLPATTRAQAKKPVRVGFSIAQTGPLSGAGKSGLLALQIWRDDVNAQGGLLGRPVELVVYDDQSNPASTPGIYTKLLDVDKVDLLIAPYATNVTAPIMPLVKQRDLLLMGNFALDVNAQFRHDKYFNNMPWSSAKVAAEPYFALCRKLGVKTVALMAADAEFAQTLANGVREEMRRQGFQSVYDQNYPPATVDFSSMLRAVRAKKPDAVYVASYPTDSAAIIRALSEIGAGSSVKIFGGGMVGLQYSTIKESLGSMLNGVVNYHVWVPERTLDFPGMREFLARYQSRAKEAKVDPLGFYVPPFDYAIGQMLTQAVTATRSLDHKTLAKYLRSNEMKTIVGGIRFNALGEWAQPRTLLVQFQGVKDKDIEQFRQPGRQVVVAPEAWRTAEVKPFADLRD